MVARKPLPLAAVAVALGKPLRTVYRWRTKGAPVVDGKADIAEMRAWAKERGLLERRPGRPSQVESMIADMPAERRSAIEAFLPKHSDMDLHDEEDEADTRSALNFLDAMVDLPTRIVSKLQGKPEAEWVELVRDELNVILREHMAFSVCAREVADSAAARKRAVQG